VVSLQPECKVNVTAACEELTKAGLKSNDWFNSYIEAANGKRFAFTGNQTGKLEYQLPPGEYTLDVYGGELMGTKSVKLTVPKDQSDYTAPPVALPPTGLLALIGKRAPELSDVVTWKGESMKLADQKGKFVLVEFWGYWCGPCIQSMPVLFDLHDKFKDQGVVIVGVHVDIDGEVDSIKALDEKLAMYKKDIWKGRDIPFPIALTVGKLRGDEENYSRGSLAAKYGIRGYPSTILIDREGKVVGKFNAHDTKAAIEQLEYLMKNEKK
jgi:thiol-disulfide isomerase/thioredoxin